MISRTGRSVAPSLLNLSIQTLINNLRQIGTHDLNSILFQMIGENILDDTHPETSQFADCKVKYLLAENKIMSTQLRSINSLVEKYKQIIDLLSKSELPSDSAPSSQKQSSGPICEGNSNKITEQETQIEINSILKQTEHTIEKCMEECKEISSAKNIFQEQEGTVTPAFFAELVLSYEKTISELKHSIHQRQILLQQLESTPNHPLKRHPQDQSESSAVVKAIQSYDIYPKISEKCRKEILELKHRKKQMEMVNSAKQSTNNRKLSPNRIEEFDKTVRKIPTSCLNQRNSEENTQVEVENMSPFEKTILIYKKKKIFNDILEAKVIDLKKKIKEKEQCNQILKKRLENEVWENIENINHYGRNMEEDDPAFLSMLNQSIRANNLDFSVDISRVMPGSMGKNETPGNLQNILEEVEQQKQTICRYGHKNK